MMLANGWDAGQLPADVATRLMAFEEEAIRSNEKTLRGWGLLRKAHRLAAAGDRTEADRCFEGGRPTIYRQVGDRYNLAATHLGRAAVPSDRGPGVGHAGHQESGRAARSMGHNGLMSECLEFLAEQAAREDREEDVVRHVEALLPLWLELRSTLSSDAERVHFAGEVAVTAERSAAYFVAKGRLERAFQLLEWGRAQALSDLIASQVEGAPARGTEEHGHSAERWEPTKPLPPKVVTACRAPLDFRGAAELLKSLGREAVFVSLVYLGDDLVGLVLRSGSPSPDHFATGITRDTVARLLATFRGEMYGEMHGKGALTWLPEGARLIRGLAPHLRQDDLVVFLLEEELQLLPFAGLELSDGELLAERAAVVYAPSVTVLGQLGDRQAQRPKRDRFDFLSIGIAFPEEALAVQRSFGGIGLTGNALPKDQIRTMLAGKSIIHLSSHGHFDPEMPLESGLHLRASGSALLNDVLSVRDLSRWHLDCDLITLSACESGRGHVAVSEFIGLTRNLLAAGGAVVATLWPVDRLPTMKFMLQFYRELYDRSERAGAVDIAESLRVTQVRLSKESGFADWAAFKLVGWPTMAVNPTPTFDEGDVNE